MKEFLSGDTIANELRMRRSGFTGAFMLVEGNSDERLYSAFVDASACQIKICLGRESLLAATAILDTDRFAGFLGIADADFEWIDPTIAVSQNLFFTDLHDLECVMVNSAAFERLLSQLASHKKLAEWRRSNNVNVRQHLLEAAVEIGYLLWHSQKEGVGLTLSNLEVREFIDRDSLRVDTAKLVQHAINKSSRHDLEANELASGILRRRSECMDLWQVCRGHDFVAVLGYALRYAWANQPAHEVTNERLELSLRLAYPSAEFFATDLCARIREWECRNVPFRIFLPR